MPWRMNRSILSFFLNFIFFVAAHLWYRYGYSYRYRWLSHLPPGCHVVTILKFRKSVVSDWWYLHYLYWHASYIITHNPPLDYFAIAIITACGLRGFELLLILCEFVIYHVSHFRYCLTGSPRMNPSACSLWFGWSFSDSIIISFSTSTTSLLVSLGISKWKSTCRLLCATRGSTYSYVEELWLLSDCF